MRVYEGKEKYIFVSYAHKDSDVVVPTIEALDKLGFRVWYDTGIAAGTEWPAYIETHLKQSEVVLVFMSPNAVASPNCRKEINYAASLNKEMLIVYITETELAHGMSLQLSSLQSMFRYRHQNVKTFIEELAKAEILQSCRVVNGYSPSIDNVISEIDNMSINGQSNKINIDIQEAQNSGNRQLIKQSRQNCPSILSNVGTKPSNDPSNAWPTTGYTNVISIDEYSNVHFHGNLIKSATKDEDKTVGLQIFNADDALVFENIIKMRFKPGYDRFSMCWSIRSLDGMPMTPGVYTALLWIDNSRVVEYKVQLISTQKKIPEQPIQNPIFNNNNNTYPQNNVPVSPYNNNIPIYPNYPGTVFTNQIAKIDEEILSLRKKLRHPRIFTVNLISQILFLICFFGIIDYPYNYDDISLVVSIVVFGIPAFALLIPVFVMTKNNVIKSGFLAFIVTFIGCSYYQIYLFIMLFVVKANKKKWLARIAELEQNKLNMMNMRY